MNKNVFLVDLSKCLGFMTDAEREDALEYYELKKFNKTGNVAVLLDDIVSTSAQVKKNMMYDILIVNTKDTTYHFNVADGAIWKEQIDTTVAQ